MIDIKILFGITGLTLGGAERVLVDLCNELCNEHDVTIFTIYAKGAFEKELSKKIRCKSLFSYSYGEMSKIKKILLPIKIFLMKSYIYHKKIKSNYDVEVAFLEGPITNILTTKNTKVRKIAWIHNDISMVFGKGRKAAIKKILNKKAYEKYEKLVFVSNDNLEKFQKTYHTNNEKHVIYNYINANEVMKKSEDNIKEIFDNKVVNFVSVCRLVEQKAINRLMNVHAKLIQAGLQHNIYVVGEGPLEEQLKEEIKNKNIENSFILLGKRDNPYPYMKKADAFCLLSSYEGYPMVVEEAKILNKFIIITDTAAREVLRNYKNKMIIENTEDGIYNGMKEMIENKGEYLYQDETFEYSNKDILEKVSQIIS